tara:strand:- start:51 stop:440 length:390 start_codon:yes stop_codon:yes gene_type:complete
MKCGRRRGASKTSVATPDRHGGRTDDKVARVDRFKVCFSIEKCGRRRGASKTSVATPSRHDGLADDKVARVNKSNVCFSVEKCGRRRGASKMSVATPPRQIIPRIGCENAAEKQLELKRSSWGSRSSKV